MENIEKQIEVLKNNGFSFNLSSLIKLSFSLWFKTLFLNIFSILFSFSLILLILTTFNNYFDVTKIDSEFLNTMNEIKDQNNLNLLLETYQNYFFNTLILARLGILSLVKVTIFPLSAGVIYCAYKYDVTGSANFKDLIIGFEGKKYVNLIGLNFIYFIISLISTLFFYIPMLFFAPVFMLAGVFIIINDIPLFKAIQLSFQTAKINFSQMLLVSVFSFITGTILSVLFINIYLFLFTIPFSLILIYSLYKTLFNPKIESANSIE